MQANMNEGNLDTPPRALENNACLIFLHMHNRFKERQFLVKQVRPYLTHAIGFGEATSSSRFSLVNHHRIPIGI